MSLNYYESPKDEASELTKDALSTMTDTENSASQRFTTEKEYIVKVVVVGDHNVGKTTLVKRLLAVRLPTSSEAPDDDGDDAAIPSVRPTIGADFFSRVLEDVAPRTSLRLQIWDSAGIERYGGLDETLYRGTSLLIGVFDRSDGAGLGRLCEGPLPRALAHLPGLASKGLFVVGNKADLLGEGSTAARARARNRRAADADAAFSCDLESEAGSSVVSRPEGSPKEGGGEGPAAVLTPREVLDTLARHFPRADYAEVSAASRTGVAALLARICAVLLRDAGVSVQDPAPGGDEAGHGIAKDAETGDGAGHGTAKDAETGNGAGHGTASPAGSWRLKGLRSFDLGEEVVEQARSKKGPELVGTVDDVCWTPAEFSPREGADTESTIAPQTAAPQDDAEKERTPPSHDPRTRVANSEMLPHFPLLSLDAPVDGASQRGGSPVGPLSTSPPRHSKIQPKPNTGGGMDYTSRDPDNEEVDRVSKTRTFRSTFKDEKATWKSPEEYDYDGAKFQENIRRRFDEIEKISASKKAEKGKKSFNSAPKNTEDMAYDSQRKIAAGKHKKHKSKCNCAVM